MPSKRFSRSTCQSEFGMERERGKEREIQGGRVLLWLTTTSLILCAIVMAIMDLLANGLWGLYFSAVSEKETSLGKKGLAMSAFQHLRVINEVCKKLCSFRANIIKLGRQECTTKNLSLCSLCVLDLLVSDLR